MILVLPYTIIGNDKVALPVDAMKLRVFVISFSFVIVCEILSIREQKTLRILQFNNRQMEKKRMKI